MPSLNAIKVIVEAEEFLQRRLVSQEIIRCEELCMNVFPNAIVNYIKRITSKDVVCSFDSIYYPIMSGVLREANRRYGFLKFTPSVEAMYWKVHDQLTNGFGESELSAIWWLSNAKGSEVDEALSYIKIHNVHSAAYMVKIIVGSRIKAPQVSHASPMATAVKGLDVHSSAVKNKSRWLKKAQLAEVELHARSNSGNKTEGRTP